MRSCPGCSTCEPGEEAIQIYASKLDGTRRVYEFRTIDGCLFACIASDLESARQRRDQWLREGGSQ